MKSRKWIGLIISLILAMALLLPGCTEESTTSAPTQTPTSSAPPTTGIITPATQTPTPTATPTVKPGTTTAGPQKYGGVFRSLTKGAISNLGYTPTVPGHMTTFVFGCLEGFVKHNGYTGEYGPWLFMSWEEDPAEKYITFHLRQGVKYHDGTDFNAQAAKDYLDLHQRVTPGWLANVTETEIIDNYTIKLHTTHYDIVMWAQLNEQTASPTQLAKGEEACLWLPVGTGPFKFVEYKRDQVLRYERFDDYWGGKPYLERYDLIFMPDAAAQLAALLAGEGDHIRAIEYKDIELLQKNGFELYSIQMVEGGLIPNTDDPESVFADKRVREAMEYAIDKKAISDALGYGFMMPYETIYPTTIPGYVPDLKRSYDLAKAKQLMADAGLADGFETTMYVSQFAIMDVMVAVQQYLAEIGIKARLSEVDMGKWTALRKTGWDGLLYQHGIFQAPYEYNLNRAYGPSYADYVSMVRPEGFNDLILKLNATTDAKARLPMAEQIQKMVYDAACFIPLVTWAQIDAVDPKIRDHEMYKIHGTQCWSPEKAWIAD